MRSVKKIIAYILAGLVLIFSILSILGIWGVINIEDLMLNMFKSLLVILASAAIIVFIFAILFRDTGDSED